MVKKTKSIKNKRSASCGSSVQDHIIDYITVDKSSYKITLERIENAFKNAESMDKQAKIIIAIKKSDLQYYILECYITSVQKGSI